MANNVGTIKIEFYRPGAEIPAVTGTDCVLKIDKRFSQARAIAEIRHQAALYLETHPNLEWRETVYKFSHSKEMKISKNWFIAV